MKAMELLPLGPVVIIDTPGYDDEGLLREQRVTRTKRILNRSDLAGLVVDGTSGIGEADRELLGLFRSKNIPHLVVMNKADLLGTDTARPDEVLYVSALTGRGIEELKERLGAMAPKEDPNHRLLGDLISPGDLVVLVCPIDESAPKGRIILPQQQAIRDILDTGAMAVVCRETELEETFRKLGTKPSLTVTDSQAFGIVDRITPDDIPLTSFSILMARYKGFLKTAAAGAAALGRLRDGDRILMAEGCTHHRQCNDIGTVKIPRWILKHTGKDLVFETCSGREFPEDLSSYAAVIHCGGCMITERDVQYRMRCALDQNVPFTNYGIVIAAMTGALERSTRMFPDVHKLL
jgi:[FeFe] hydrogenase H-cluster maturation GTPase HydF